jgi:cold shock CspA family protein
MSEPRQEGTLKTWNDQRGTGFIANTNGVPDLPVQAAAFLDDGYLPNPGEVLTLKMEPESDGKLRAVSVQRFAEPASSVAKAGSSKGRKLRLSKAAPGLFTVYFCTIKSDLEAGHGRADCSFGLGGLQPLCQAGGADRGRCTYDGSVAGHGSTIAADGRTFSLLRFRKQPADTSANNRVFSHCGGIR